MSNKHTKTIWLNTKTGRRTFDHDPELHVERHLATIVKRPTPSADDRLLADTTGIPISTVLKWRNGRPVAGWLAKTLEQNASRPTGHPTGHATASRPTGHPTDGSEATRSRRKRRHRKKGGAGPRPDQGHDSHAVKTSLPGTDRREGSQSDGWSEVPAP